MMSTLGQNITDQHLTAEKLKRAQRQLQLAGKLARIGGWSIELSTCRVIWSDEACHIFEVAPGTAPTIDELLNFYPPEWRVTVDALLKRCAQVGTPYDHEAEIVTAKGRRICIHEVGQAERNDAGQITRVVGAVRDVTPMKGATDDARRSADRLLTTLESITDAFFMLDHEWRFTFLNCEAVRLLGQGRDELLGRVIWDVFPEATGTKFYSEYHRAVRDSTQVSFDEYYQPFDKWFHVRAYASVDGLAAYFQDITEQRIASEALRESETRLRLLAQATTDTIWDWNLRSGLVWWSDGIERTFGYLASEVDPTLQWWAERVHPEDRNRVMQSVHEAVNQRTGHWSGEYRFLRKDGSLAHVVDRGFILFDDCGNAVRMVGGIADESEKKRFEERIRHSQRLEAIQQLTSGIAHDFNNMLEVILGNAEMLLEDLADQPQQRRMAELIQQAANRAADTTRRMLAFSRQQELQPAIIDCNQLIENVAVLLRRALGEEFSLVLELTPAVWPVWVDHAELEAALLKLAINSRDAMTSGGKIKITTENIHVVDGKLPLPELLPGPYVRLAVADEGAGMLPDVSGHAFDPFFTTKQVGKGTGLGLSEVHGFVRQTGGEMSIESTMGQGTTVALWLRRHSSAAIANGDENKAGEVPGGSETILVVEDEPMVRSYVAAQLARLGYRVIEARDGNEALAVLRAESSIQLLFTDMVMPGGMRGNELARKARALRPKLGVLFTSGSINEIDDESRPSDDSIPILYKPYARRDLAEYVRRSLDDVTGAAPAEIPNNGN